MAHVWMSHAARMNESWNTYERVTKHSATHCNTPATYCITKMRQRITRRKNVNMLQHTALHGNILQHAAAHCNTLHHTVETNNSTKKEYEHITRHKNHYNSLQHTAAHGLNSEHTKQMCARLYICLNVSVRRTWLIELVMCRCLLEFVIFRWLLSSWYFEDLFGKTILSEWALGHEWIIEFVIFRCLIEFVIFRRLIWQNNSFWVGSWTWMNHWVRGTQMSYWVRDM